MKFIAIHWQPGPPEREKVDVEVFHELIDATVWMDTIRPLSVQTFNIQDRNRDTPVIVAQGETGPGYFVIMRTPEVSRFEFVLSDQEQFSCKWQRAQMGCHEEPTWSRLPNYSVRVLA